MEHVDVVVVGAGVSGLAAAWAAEQEGCTVAVLEADSDVGGVIRSTQTDGFLVESGATSMSGSAELMRLLDQMGLSGDVLLPPPASRRRYILREGLVCALPSSPGELITTSALSWRGKLRAVAEPFIRRTQTDAENESVAQLVRRRFGQEVLDYFVDPFVSGIYAGDPDRLSSQYALRTLHELETEHGSVLRGMAVRARRARARSRSCESPPAPVPHLLSLRGGMQQLPQALARSLQCGVRHGCRLKSAAHSDADWQLTITSREGLAVIRSSALVVALPAHALDEIAWPPAIAPRIPAVAGVEHAPIATISLGFRRDQIAHALDGFGLLVPHRERRSILGVLFNSSMFPNRAPAGDVLLTCFVGGARFAGTLAATDAEASALSELVPMLGIQGKPVFISSHVWPRGIPQPTLGHERVLAALTRLEGEVPSVCFAGSFRTGVAVGDCVTSGVAAGRRMAGIARHVSRKDYEILAAAGSHSL